MSDELPQGRFVANPNVPRDTATASPIGPIARRLPRTCVLLATYNGGKWLDEQLRSIFEQSGVKVSVIVSDDRSTDSTTNIVQSWSGHAPLILMPGATERFGSAHRNFLRLIREAPLGDAEYVALADQDDIWLPDKLARAVHCLRTLPADAYSSDVIAFWSDGRRRFIRKSQPQRSHDYLFGSPGPGCTFVMPRAVFDRMRSWVAAEFDHMQGIWVHDWLIYAYARAQGLRWHIDDRPNLLYRQHGRNEIGVNDGWRAALSRLRHVRSGAYRSDILAIAEVVGESSRIATAVRRLTVGDRFWLIGHVRQFRRRLSECLILAFFILLMPHDRRS